MTSHLRKSICLIQDFLDGLFHTSYTLYFGRMLLLIESILLLAPSVVYPRTMHASEDDQSRSCPVEFGCNIMIY